MSPELQVLITAFFATLGTGFGAWLSYRATARKTKESTMEVIEAASGRLVKRIEDRMVALENKLTAAEKEIAEKDACITRLEKRVDDLEKLGQEKDQRIADLVSENLAKDAKISDLEKRVDELESELAKVRGKRR